MAIVNTSAGRWFRRVVWLGIVVNLALALPTLAAPDQMLAFSRLPTVTPHLWVRFAGVLLILLSAFYVPAAMDPDRYRAIAWLAVVSRLTGVVFFFGEPAVYRVMGFVDLVFFLPEAALLFVATRNEAAAPKAPAASPMTGASVS